MWVKMEAFQFPIFLNNTIKHSVFDKLIWPISPKSFFIWHYTVLSLGQIAQLIMIILSLTALTLLLIRSRCTCIPNGTHINHC